MVFRATKQERGSWKNQPRASLKWNKTPWHFTSVQVLFWCYHDDRTCAHATSCVVGSCDWDLWEHTGMFVWIKLIAEVSGQQIWNMSFVIWADNTEKSILCHPLFGVGVILSSRKGSWGCGTAGVPCWWRLSGSLPARFCFHPGTHFSHPIGGQIAGPWFSFCFPLSLQHNPHFGQIDALKPP